MGGRRLIALTAAVAIVAGACKDDRSSMNGCAYDVGGRVDDHDVLSAPVQLPSRHHDVDALDEFHAELHDEHQRDDESGDDTCADDDRAGDDRADDDRADDDVACDHYQPADDPGGQRAV